MVVVFPYYYLYVAIVLAIQGYKIPFASDEAKIAGNEYRKAVYLYLKWDPFRSCFFFF